MITIKPGFESTYRDLEDIVLDPPPGAGPWWKGVPHADLVETIIAQIINKGWKLQWNDLILFASPDEYDMAGSIRAMAGELTFSIGFINSNSRKRGIKLFIGEGTSGAVISDIVLCKKHTRHFELLPAVMDAFDECEKRIQSIPEIVAKWKRMELKEDLVNTILMIAGRKNLMPWSRIGLVDELYRESDEPTAWRLYQAFVAIVKQNPPLSQMDQMEGFRRLLPEGKQAL